MEFVKEIEWNYWGIKEIIDPNQALSQGKYIYPLGNRLITANPGRQFKRTHDDEV